MYVCLNFSNHSTWYIHNLTRNKYANIFAPFISFKDFFVHADRRILFWPSAGTASYCLSNERHGASRYAKWPQNGTQYWRTGSYAQRKIAIYIEYRITCICFFFFQYSRFRKGLLAAYTIILILFVVVLVLIVVLAPIEDTFNKLKSNWTVYGEHHSLQSQNLKLSIPRNSLKFTKYMYKCFVLYIRDPGMKFQLFLYNSVYLYLNAFLV